MFGILQFRTRIEQQEYLSVERTFGRGLALEMAAERRVALRSACAARLPGALVATPSSNLHYEVLSGRIDDIDFSHALSTPRNFAERTPLDLSLNVERALAAKHL